MIDTKHDPANMTLDANSNIYYAVSSGMFILLGIMCFVSKCLHYLTARDKRSVAGFMERFIARDSRTRREILRLPTKWLPYQTLDDYAEQAELLSAGALSRKTQVLCDWRSRRGHAAHTVHTAGNNRSGTKAVHLNERKNT